MGKSIRTIGDTWNPSIRGAKFEVVSEDTGWVNTGEVALDRPGVRLPAKFGLSKSFEGVSWEWV